MPKPTLEGFGHHFRALWRLFFVFKVEKIRDTNEWGPSLGGAGRSYLAKAEWLEPKDWD